MNDSEVTFAGYRFSEDLRGMGDWMRVTKGGAAARAKMYTITFNKQFRRAEHLSQLQPPNLLGSGAERSLQPDGIALLRHRRFQNVSVSLSTYRNRYNERNDDGCICRCRCHGAVQARSVTT